MTNPYPEHVDRDAAVVVRQETRIDAPIERVWRLHTDVDGWPQWHSDIDTAHAGGPLAVGSTFHWSTAGLSIASTVYAIDAPHRILWGGPAQGITGIHQWTFAPEGSGVLVRTEESWDGEQVRADRANLQTALDASITSWLAHLRKVAESQPA
jgi:uncharacterized protein YndB with AHSA1/START domain